jgi:hypothetical protein
VARKVAYLYQDEAKPMLVGYFVDENIRDYLTSQGIDANGLSLVDLHKTLISSAQPEDTLQDLGMKVHNFSKNLTKDKSQQTASVEEEKEEYNEDLPQMWHYTFDHKDKDAEGLNDLNSLLTLGEINIDIDCGDLSDLPAEHKPGTTEAARRIKEKMDEGDDEPSNKGLMAWHIGRRMQVGDLIFARVRFKDSSNFYFIYGRVSGDYRYEEGRPAYRHARTVIWIKTDDMTDRTKFSLQSKALTYLRKSWETERNYLLDAFKIDLTKLPPVYENPTCEILYGPPGTGKTYNTRKHAIQKCLGKKAFNKDDDIQSRLQFDDLRAQGQVEFVTFHQSYDYSDFVVGFKPVTKGDSMVFEPKPGVLLRIAKRARENKDRPYLLIIDEINRGYISKIFGELITLVEKDKRAGKGFALTVTLPCSCPDYLEGPEHNLFSLPPNVHILGTMNTADRSISTIDSALRRRFYFTEMKPLPELCPVDIEGINVRRLLINLNALLAEKLTPEHQIGHSELMLKPKRSKGSDVVAVVNLKIIPQINEWLHDDLEAREELLSLFAAKDNDGIYRTTSEKLARFAS